MKKSKCLFALGASSAWVCSRVSPRRAACTGHSAQSSYRPAPHPFRSRRIEQAVKLLSPRQMLREESQWGEQRRPGVSSTLSGDQSVYLNERVPHRLGPSHAHVSSAAPGTRPAQGGSSSSGGFLALLCILGIYVNGVPTERLPSPVTTIKV